MNLLSGWWLLLGLAVLALALVQLGAAWLHRRRLSRVFTGVMLDRVHPLGVRLRRTGRDVLVGAGLLCAVAALADPQVGVEFHELEQSGIDLVIALDLSRSMDAEDVSPSRLERARREIRDLVDLAGDDRIGLVVYAGGAFKRMPLTRDRDALVELVDELDTETFQVQGSELGAALRAASELLGQQRAEAGQAILILSDGEVHDPEDALTAARAAAKAGVRIFAMGIGHDAAPIPLSDGTWLTDRGGQTVLSRPTQDVMVEVARIGSGAYVRSVASGSDMERMYITEIRGSVDAASTGVITKEIPKRGYQWPLGLGVVLILAGAWLGDGHRRWGAAAVALLGLSLLTSNPALAGPRAEGDALYRGGDYPEAVEVFTELSMERPGDPDVWRRLGTALYQVGRFDEAAAAWDTQARLEGRGTTALYNSGNAHYLAGRLDEARSRYEAVLEDRPGHFRAEQNLQLVTAELEQRRAPPPEQPQQQEGSDQEGQEGEQGEQQEGQGEQGGEQGQDGQTQPGDQGSEGQDRQPGADQESGQSADQRQGEVEGGEPGSGEEDAGTADLDQLEGETEDGPAAAGQEGEIPEGAPMTEAQARRLLEGVEEAQPRVLIPGQGQGDKAW